MVGGTGVVHLDSADMVQHLPCNGPTTLQYDALLAVLLPQVPTRLSDS